MYASYGARNDNVAKMDVTLLIEPSRSYRITDRLG